jgi:hydrogenase maturation protease
MSRHLAATLKSLHRSILVIGYGSPLRSDDGVGQQIVKAIAAWGLPNVEAIAVHQLTPELVEPIATVDIAIFIDAYPATVDQEIQVRSLEVAQSGLTSGHWWILSWVILSLPLLSKELKTHYNTLNT